MREEHGKHENGKNKKQILLAGRKPRVQSEHRNQQRPQIALSVRSPCYGLVAPAQKRRVGVPIPSTSEMGRWGLDRGHPVKTRSSGWALTHYD